MNETRYDVTLTDGTQVERHVAVDWRRRNRLVDFGWRHGLRVVVHETERRGNGRYR